LTSSLVYHGGIELATTIKMGLGKKVACEAGREEEGKPRSLTGLEAGEGRRKRKMSEWRSTYQGKRGQISKRLANLAEEIRGQTKV
jgi:hypothetical protein